MLKNKTHNVIALFLITIIFSSCSNYDNGYKTDSEKPSYMKIAKEKYHTNINYLFAPDSLHIICYKTEKKSINNPTPQHRFFIYDLKNEKINFEDKGRSDNIKWINNNQIRVLTRPGIISVDPKKNIKLLGYIYDINQKKKLPLSKPGNIKLK